jgi:signal transduction histidine kinase
VPPDEVIPTVIDEIGRILGADATLMTRLDPDGGATIVARKGHHPPELAARNRFELDPGLAMTEVLQTGRPARRDGYENVGERMAGVLQRMGVRSAVAIPVLVNGRIWGALGVTTGRGPFPPVTERRMASFTELVAMAISNAESRAELAASRGRIVAASDEARRRIERDLHDGAQQRLVSLGLELRQTQSSVPEEFSEVRSGIGKVADELAAVVDEVREMARGIHPAILSEGGLRPALRTLARRAAVPVELDITTDARFPQPVEVAAYYVVSEALTNAAKHADASCVCVSLAERADVLELVVRDDGVGGAAPGRGSGLIGLRDRVEALGGTIAVTSPQGIGTTVRVSLPTAIRLDLRLRK